ncbi:MAG: hypothetical protein VYA67_13405 [Actinomycetota bacterium]|uniref:Uncharacterized protein n=1 Tax=Mycobacterium lentiflavum TaxID=141349 RepID=A0ABY3UTJ8_MYCLN|nr:hypothetical protein [Mycobacterium lentiflavum]MEE3064937.1 hypothetical protein [Actinomycetota bacterium]ULP41853.1 hypothetical protein MJO58_23990 [Mycobacterium lentiflavum]
MTGLACGADSFWVADHLNSVPPPSMWNTRHLGAARTRLIHEIPEGN